jgi:cyanobactin maturation PatA/PatG family protease
MKLYFSPGACSLSPHIVLREAGVLFELEQVDLRTKRTSTGTDFLLINAKGLVPVLLLDDGDVLTEGPAIVQYIADMVPAMRLAPPPGSKERYRLQEWLNFITSELHKNFSPLFRLGTPEVCKSIAVELIADRFGLVDAHLSDHEYLMGEHFTVSDAYLFYTTHAAQRVGLDFHRWPNLIAFRERVASRPSVQAAIRAEGLQIPLQQQAGPVHDPLSDLRAALGSAGSGLSSVKIGIVDGLPDLTHPALQHASIEVLAAMVPEGSWTPDSHGTSVSSIILGDGSSVRGIAPGCSGIVLPIFFGKQTELRPKPASQLDLARAITLALENDVSIINVSAGQRVATPAADTHLEQALQRSEELRVLVVAAAGNDGCACLHLPAGVASVLAVGAVDVHGKPLEASNFGDAYQQNGLLAPGENLVVALPNGMVSTASGTSYATAVVSGVAALLLSVARRENYPVDAIDVRRILLDTAVHCPLAHDEMCDRFLVGMLDGAAALALLHQIGATRKWAKVTTADPISVSIMDPPHVVKGMEHTMTTHSDAMQSETATIEAPGLTPSATHQQNELAEDLGSNSASQANISPASLTSALASSPNLSRVSQQACSCGGGQTPQIIYALGALWFDFGTEARHDAFVQQLGDPIQANNPNALISFLRENLQFAGGLTFILMQEQIPLYAIQPAGPFALETYNAMLDALTSSMEAGGNEQRVSIPGVISGSTRLLNGMIVPVMFPDLRGMYKWRSEHLIELSRAAAPEHTETDDAILNFLNRVYYELRNLGVAPQDRAINYAATNAFQARQAFADAVGRSLALDSIKVIKSPICRPDSDCWDVELVMFDDEDERRPNRIYRFTVDVSETIPVTIGTVRTWASRASGR